ncbi:RcnB family protein [Cupriavidus basilensis]|uniref:RcnB family protein n=1 Tax=Cupriavidus basilensis TaxID=68895 RepID=UPI0020A676B7|nr:RcnB family protein [Cupriavidus basilensis]MCP3017507.1 RcnB family protein [Cupriavidus basilensis]
MRKIKVFASLALAACTLTSIAGYAQDRGPGGDDRGRPPMGHDQGHDQGRDHDNQHGYNDRGREGDHRDHDQYREGDRGREQMGGWDSPDRRADRPGPGSWHRGERVPPEYRQRQYVIDDWHAYRLSPPPRGYQWVGVGGDYFLVAIPTGVVFQVVIGR